MTKPTTPNFRKAMNAAQRIEKATTPAAKKRRIAEWAAFVKAAMHEDKKP